MKQFFVYMCEEVRRRSQWFVSLRGEKGKKKEASILYHWDECAFGVGQSKNDLKMCAVSSRLNLIFTSKMSDPASQDPGCLRGRKREKNSATLFPANSVPKNQCDVCVCEREREREREKGVMLERQRMHKKEGKREFSLLSLPLSPILPLANPFPQPNGRWWGELSGAFRAQDR